MKYLIKKVLDKYKDKQLDLSSDDIREQIASEIEAKLIKNEQIRQIERALYRGEG